MHARATVLQGVLAATLAATSDLLRGTGDGGHRLFALMEAASGMIRRDIVFAASLYVA